MVLGAMPQAHATAAASAVSRTQAPVMAGCRSRSTRHWLQPSTAPSIAPAQTTTATSTSGGKSSFQAANQVSPGAMNPSASPGVTYANHWRPLKLPGRARWTRPLPD